MTSDDASGSEWDRATRELYARLIETWDKRNARDFALLFASDGNVVGFDGSQVNGQLEVGAFQAVHCRPGEWVRYSSPGPEGAEYIAVCLPAFSPATVHRDE